MLLVINNVRNDGVSTWLVMLTIYALYSIDTAFLHHKDIQSRLQNKQLFSSSTKTTRLGALTFATEVTRTPIVCSFKCIHDSRRKSTNLKTKKVRNCLEIERQSVHQNWLHRIHGIIMSLNIYK